MTRPPMKRNSGDNQIEDGWVNTVIRLSGDRATLERATTMLLLRGVTVGGSDGMYVADNNRAKYGRWEGAHRCAVAYCLAEGLDIET